MNDCLIFIKNVLKESKNRKINDKDTLDYNVSVYDVTARLIANFDDEATDVDPAVIRQILVNCSQEDLNRIYFKNNLFEFCNQTKIKSMWKNIIENAKGYKNPDPDKTPKELRELLDEMWFYLNEYVFYRHEYVDRVYRVTNKERKVALVIDTDSNMVYLNPWVNFIKQNVLDESLINERDTDDLRHSIIYTMCYQLAEMIRSYLRMYLEHCNVEDARISILDMKNEYLFSRMLITENKKNYGSIIEFKEGQDMHRKLDVKGLPINKSSTNRNAAAVFKKILEHDILKSEGEIDIIEILCQLQDLEDEIRESIKRGENTYLKPASVNDPQAYDDPLKITGYRGAMIWNIAYPDKEISFPDSFFLVKTTLIKPDMLDGIEDDNIREALREQIFNNPNKRIKSKGVYVCAIPRDELIPEWLIPFVDIDTMICDIMKAMLPILNALGGYGISTSSSDSYYSNFIEI